jgi:hypothetical protein
MTCSLQAKILHIFSRPSSTDHSYSAYSSLRTRHKSHRHSAHNLLLVHAHQNKCIDLYRASVTRNLQSSLNCSDTHICILYQKMKFSHLLHHTGSTVSSYYVCHTVVNEDHETKFTSMYSWKKGTVLVYLGSCVSHFLFVLQHCNQSQRS